MVFADHEKQVVGSAAVMAPGRARESQFAMKSLVPCDKNWLLTYSLFPSFAALSRWFAGGRGEGGLVLPPLCARCWPQPIERETVTHPIATRSVSVRQNGSRTRETLYLAGNSFLISQ